MRKWICHFYVTGVFNHNLQCGENLRGYLVKKKNMYCYKCDGKSNCKCNVSAKKLHKSFEDLLNDIILDDDYQELYKLELRKIYNTVKEK